MQATKRARRRARVLAVQALYQVEVAGISPEQAVRTARRLTPGDAPSDESRARDRGASEGSSDDGAPEEIEYATLLARYAWSERHRVDALIAGTSTRWKLSRLGRMEVQVLRVAAAEMLRCPEVPAPIVIDEAIELARAFAGDEAARFVNGVADAIARQLAAERGDASASRAPVGAPPQGAGNDGGEEPAAPGDPGETKS